MIQAMNDVDQLRGAKHTLDAIRNEVGKVIVGQEHIVEQVLIGMLAAGHCLLDGVPGLAKTRLIRSIASALDIKFGRVQFTPDLMPADVTGTEIIQEDPETGRRAFQFLPGPIFANLLLADEINRTPPKTQAAMLEAMQERQVTVGGKAYALPHPFFVLATQNPLDQEGTYALPEAQLDRFLLKIKIDYPQQDDEWEIAERETSEYQAEVQAVANGNHLLQLQQLVRRCPISEQVMGYAVALIRSTRPGDKSFDFVNEYVSFGVGPRGLITLVQCAKARAILHGRDHATMEDVRKIVHAVLRHRIGVNFAAESSGVDSDTVVSRLLDAVSDRVVYRRGNSGN